MGWLKGSTDITNFQADLYDLLTGAMAAGTRGSGQAGNGVTLNVTDRWTGIDATSKFIRSQRTEDPWTSEYALYRGCPRFAARATGTVLAATPAAQLGKPTFSGAYSGGTGKVYFAAFVSTNNAAPGSLASTIITWTLVNAVTGVTVTSGSATGWSGASDTKLLAQGVSLTLTLQPSESFIGGTNAVMWLRAYTTTFTQGIDYWPEAGKIKAGTLVVSNTSLGANNYISGTDYALAQEAHQFPGQSTTTGTFDISKDWGGTGAGCGIHWNTGGSPPAVGANYFAVDYEVYAAYLNVPPLINSGGNRTLMGGPAEWWDGTLAVGRAVIDSAAGKTDLNTVNPYGTLFTGTGQPGSTFINFWITVKQDKIILILRGDTGQGGLTTVWTFQRYTNLPITDKHPWMFMGDGSQTRSGCFLVSHKFVYDTPYWGDPTISIGVIGGPFCVSQTELAASFNLLFTGLSREDLAGVPRIPDNNPNSWDQRWWLYTMYVHASKGGGNISGVFDATKDGPIRGKTRGIFAVAFDNFANLDELIDGSNTYLLVTPSSRFGADQGGSYNAVAVLEE